MTDDTIVDPSNEMVCAYCHHQFKRDAAYLKHRCKEMVKQEEVRSPIGQAAYIHYSTWFKAQGRVSPTNQTFADSRMYRSFINFATFCQQVNLPLPERFIYLMVARRIEPNDWTKNTSYVTYLEYLDTQAPPLELVRMSINTIVKWSEKLDIDTSQFFTILTVQEIIVLVQKRRLTPWLLLLSKSFIAAMNSAAESQVLMLKELIRPAVWHQRLATQPDAVEKIKKLVSALGL